MTTQITKNEKTRANSTQQTHSQAIKAAFDAADRKDVILTTAPGNAAMWMVLPKDTSKELEFYFSPIVAKTAADFMARQSGGKVVLL